jgi:Co/Zn/Cd efflux system component
MADCCQVPDCSNDSNPPGRSWRTILWIALAVNLGMFGVEIAAGVASGSTALRADSLDFLGDAANYGISLGVAGLALQWRSRAALIKAATLMAFGGWVIASALWSAWFGASPRAEVMGAVGAVAMLANLAVALLLHRFRNGDANMRSVWICTRNDVLGNLAVLVAAGGVFGLGNRWPDVAVAAIMAVLAVTGGWQVVRQARRELAPAPFAVTARRPRTAQAQTAKGS